MSPSAVTTLARWCQWVSRVAGYLLGSSIVLPLRLLMTVAALLWVFARVDVGRLVYGLFQTNLQMLALSLVCVYAAWTINSYKWQRLLSLYHVDRPVGELLRLNLVAIFYSTVLPGQVTGEVIKAIRVGKSVERPGAGYLSIFQDRLTGLIGLALIGILALLVGPPSSVPETGRLLSVVIFVTVAIGGAGVLLVSMCAMQLSASPTSRLARMTGMLPAAIREAIFAGGKVSVARVACIVGLGIAFQSLSVAANWIVGTAVGVNVPPLAVAWAVALTSLIQFFPVSVAGLGVRELTYTTILGWYGAPTDLALTMSLLVFVLLVVLASSGAWIELVQPFRGRQDFIREGTVNDA